jgi:hypothetical protein
MCYVAGLYQNENTKARVVFWMEIDVIDVMLCGRNFSRASAWPTLWSPLQVGQLSAGRREGHTYSASSHGTAQHETPDPGYECEHSYEVIYLSAFYLHESIESRIKLLKVGPVLVVCEGCLQNIQLGCECNICWSQVLPSYVWALHREPFTSSSIKKSCTKWCKGRRSQGCISQPYIFTKMLIHVVKLAYELRFGAITFRVFALEERHARWKQALAPGVNKPGSIQLHRAHSSHGCVSQS